jgi:hypothetical protein
LCPDEISGDKVTFDNDSVERGVIAVGFAIPVSPFVVPSIPITLKLRLLKPKALLI